MSSATRVTRVALVTGANKGIGYHIADQLARGDSSLQVLVGSRDATRGAEAASQLGLPNVAPITIDIDDRTSIEQAADTIKKQYGGIDVLVNNAGMAFKGDAFDENVVSRTMKTNYYGTLDTINAFLPLLRTDGKIINVSSMASVSALNKMRPELKQKFLDPTLTMTQLTSLLEEFRTSVAAGDFAAKGYPKTAYGMSKVGVSILTQIFARSGLPRGITSNSGCPGWCRTDMAGSSAPRTAEEGARTFSHLALLPTDQTPNGQFWEDCKVSSITR